MNKALEFELAEQQKVRDTHIILMCGLCVALTFIAFSSIPYKDLISVCVLGFMARQQFFIWPPVRDELQDRLTMVLFKTQVKNMFVTSKDEHDTSVVQYWKDTVETLVRSGNKTGCAVYLMMFRDTHLHWAYIDNSGKVKVMRKERDAGSTYEDFDRYKAWCQKTVLELEDRRARELNSSIHAKDWVFEHYYNQEFLHNG